MGKKQAGENTKKAAGNAKARPLKKAEAANSKAAAANAQAATAEDAEWSKGSKSNKKAEEAEAKKAEAARKKAEKEALLAAEEKEARATPKNSKTAVKKGGAPTKGLDLAQLDEPAGGSKTNPALNATGIDNALDALSLTNNDASKIDRHPERRFKAAYAAYEARRMPEVEEENKGLRKNQREALIRKEFERSPENPFNQANARFDSTREEVKEMKEAERTKVEERLAEK